MKHALVAIFLAASSCAYAEEDISKCPSGKFIHPDKLRERGLEVGELKLKSQQNVIRYLSKTEGNPPKLSHWPGYTMYIAYQTASAFVENGHYLTPPSIGTIAITQKGCIMYQIDGRADAVIKIAKGTWSLSTQ
jgi:hypothetical protein